MGRALKYIFYIAILGVVALAGYAVLDDLPPPTKSVTVDLPPPARPSE